MIRLEQFTDRDFPRLIQWVVSPELLVQWAGPRLFSWPLDLSQLRRYLADSLAEPPSCLIFKALDEQDRVVGHLELGAIDNNSRSATLCRVMIAPEARGQGICYPMVQSALTLAFGPLDFRRIDLRVYTFNDPAVRCYERAGFVREGVLREAVKVGDAYWDTVLMAVMRDEWEQRRRAAP